MGGKGCGEHAGAFVANGVSGAVVDVGGNVQAEAGVAVFVVVLMRVIVSRAGS